MAEDALQCGFCTPGQIVSASALIAADPDAHARGHPRRHGGQHLPLRRVSEDRARDPARVRAGGRMRPRLVKSQREMEGRFEDVWVLVDEDDDLETWAEGAELDVVGKPATRHDGLLRTSGAARYTVDIALPGMLHAQVLRAPVARCRVTGLDLEAARATPGVRAVLGPDGPFTMRGDAVLTAEPGWAGAPIAAVAADTPEAAAAGIAALSPELEALAPLELEAGLEEQRFTEEPRETVRGDPDGALDGAEVKVELDVRDPRTRPDAARAARGRRALGRGFAHRLDLDPGDVRCAAGARGALRARKRAGAGDLGVHRRRVRREARRRRRGAPRGRAGARRGSARAPGARQARGPARRRPAGLDAPDGHDRCPPRRHPRRDRGRSRGGDGGRGLDLPGRRAGALALRLPERPRDDLPRQDQPSRAKRVPCARRGGGGDGARAGDGRARARARDGSARAATARTTSTLDQGSGLPYSSKRLLACYDRAAELAGWAERDAAPRGAARTACCAGWAARRRSGGAAAARRRTRRSASTRRHARS